MTLAYWMVLAAAFVPYMGTAYAKFSDGGAKTYDNRAPRVQMETLPLKRRRGYWAQLNGFEAFPPFAAAVIVAHLAGASQPTSRRATAAGTSSFIRSLGVVCLWSAGGPAASARGTLPPPLASPWATRSRP